MNRFASPLSLLVAGILGAFVSQGLSKWMPEAQAQDRAEATEIKARKLIVVDENGNPGLTLFAESAAAVIKLDVGGQPRIVLIASSKNAKALRKPGAASLILYEEGLDAAALRAGIPSDLASVMLTVSDKGRPSVAVYEGPDGRAIMGTNDDGAGVLEINKDKKVIWKAP